jgi:hypothetical protein
MHWMITGFSAFDAASVHSMATTYAHAVSGEPLDDLVIAGRFKHDEPADLYAVKRRIAPLVLLRHKQSD